MNTSVRHGSSDHLQTKSAAEQFMRRQDFPSLPELCRWRALALLGVLCLCALSACTSADKGRSQIAGAGAGDGIAVIGITAASGLDIAFNRNLLSRDFSELVASRGSFAVLPASSVRQYTGPLQLDTMLNTYARTGRLMPRDVQLLMAAGMPVRRAVLARVEEDIVQNLQARREPVFNNAGAILVDRERRVLGTQRMTRLSAQLIDLQTGKLLWTQQYRVDPVVEVASTHYLGSSFSGALAAAFANTVVNGVRVASHPEPPPLRTSLQSLLHEVANNLPVR